MAETKKEKDFTAYEYFRVSVIDKDEPLYVDTYQNFGWELIDSSSKRLRPEVVYGIDNKVVLQFRRAKDKGSIELDALQKNVDFALGSIEKLEKRKTLWGTVWSLLGGMLATGLFAVGVWFTFFEDYSNNAHLWAGIPCMILGALMFISPYFVNEAMVKRSTAKLQPQIESQLAQVETLCKEAKKLSGAK